jgi:PAS domain S-box-containing protein
MRMRSYTRKSSSDRDGRVALDAAARNHPLLFKLVFPIAASAAALVLAKLTTPYADGPILIYFTLAAALSTWLSGPLAGVATLTLGFLEAFYFLLAPIHSFRVANPGQIVRLAAECSGAALAIYLLSRLRTEQDRSRRATAIVHSSQDAIIGKTLGGIITSWNRGAEQLYGYAAAEVLGKPMSILIPPGHPDELTGILHRLGRGERIDRYETTRRRKDGSSVEVAVTISPIHDSAGTVIGASSIAYDITARKRAEQAVAEQARLLDLSYDAIMVRDPEDHIVYWNEGAVHAYGYTRDEAMGRVPHKLLQTEFPQPLEQIFDTLRRDGHWTGELVHTRKDGTRLTVSSRWALDRDGRDNHASILETNTDITERKRVEEALRNAIIESEARENALQSVSEQLKTMFDSVPATIWYKDTNNNFLRVNRAVAALTGKTVEEIEGRSAWEVFPAQADAYYADDLEVIRSKRSKLGIVERVTVANGQVRWVQTDKVPVFDSAGEILGLLVFAIDITERKQAEDALRESEQQFRTLANSIPQLCWMANAEGWIVWYNQRWYDYTGTTPEQMEGWGLQSVHDPVELPRVTERWRGSIQKGEPLEMVFPLRRADGVFREFLTRVIPIKDAGGKVVRWFGTNTDITQQREIEQALRTERDFSTAVLETAAALTVVIDRQGRITRFNRACEALTGFTAAEACGLPIWDFIPPEDICGVRQTWDALCAGNFPNQLENHWVSRTGSRRLISWSNTALLGADGTVQYIIASGVDITERKLAENALRRSEARLRRFYESGTVAVMYWNTDGAITDANDKFLDVIGYTRADLTNGRVSWADITPPEYREADEAALRELNATGVGTPYEKQYIRKDGSRVPIVINSAMLDEARHEGVAFVLDISERKRAEQALIRSEKLASVGRMAATVAHEINNPLELIMNSVYIASLDKSLSSRARENLTIAEQELERVAHLTRQTLGFYRENTVPTTVNVSELVKDVVEIYSPKFMQRGIAVHVENESGLQIHAIAGEIRQVVSNIVSNAIDASPQDSRLSVRTSRVTLNGTSCARLTFADTGEGITPENLNHIFEPFFTTKKSVGTGLGLWVTSEIVHRHQGRIRVRSRQGQGTVFSIFLPEVPHQIGRAHV